MMDKQGCGEATGETDPKLTFNVLKVVVKLTMKPEQLGMPFRQHTAAVGRPALTRAPLPACTQRPECASI